MAAIVRIPAIVAIGRRSGRRSGPRSTNGSRKSMIMQKVGTPMVANGTSSGGLITRRTSKRKKKYHSGRGTYVDVVGSALGPNSAPRTIDIVMMTTITNSIMMLSFATAYGKNGLPLDFSSAYSRRYSSFSRWFISDVLLAELGVDVGPHPRRCRGAELGDEVEMGADQRGDQPG